MTRSVWNKRFPTLVGMVLLVISVVTTSFFLQKGTSIVSRADSEAEPHNIRISNISDTTATISFTTDKESIATIAYGTSPTTLTNTLSDARDKGTTPSSRMTHQFILENLQSNTNYSFSITSDGELYKGDPDPYAFATGNGVTFTNTNDHKITGKIIHQDGTVATNVLIYVSSETTQDFSTITGLDGGFTIPLQNIRSSDLSQALSVTDDTIMSLQAVDGKTESTVVFRFNNATPLPTIILGNSYDFSSPQADANFVPKENSENTFPLVSLNADPSSPKISSPKKDEILVDTTPTLQGSAKANETVTIELSGKEKVGAKVVSTKQGVWKYTPSKPLALGDYTLRVTAKNDKGVTAATTLNFSLEAAR